MSAPNSSIDDVEHQRCRLEGNVRKLQESLYYWRTWEAEYDGLKDEIESLREDASVEDFLRAGRNFGGSLVNESEIKILLGEKQGVMRSREQVIHLIGRRIDYVKRNTATVEMRLQHAEDQVRGMDATGSLSTETESKKYHAADIIEELDEDGRVISSSVKTPGDHAPELLEALKKAGVSDIPDAPVARKEDGGVMDGELARAKHEGEQESLHGQDNDIQNRYLPSTHLKNNGTTDGEHGSGVSTLPDESTEDDKERPATVVDESPEDAKLRREMLQYGLNEVGAIVAELELDEDGSEFSIDDEYEPYDYGTGEDEEDDEEDKYGRATGRILSEEYHEQMRALERKLSSRGMYSFGKDTEALSTQLGQDLNESPAEEPGIPATEKKPKKKVAFAEDIDIAPLPKRQPQKKDSVPPRTPDVPALSESIIERTNKTEGQPVADTRRKTSRFKKALCANQSNTNGDVPGQKQGSMTSRPRDSQSAPRYNACSNLRSLPLSPASPKGQVSPPQSIPDTVRGCSVPQPPENRILADKLVERENTKIPVAPEEDDISEQLLRKEVATEFYQLRSRIVHSNGGFMNNDELKIVPLDTDEPPKRVSRFKAARIV